MKHFSIKAFLLGTLLHLAGTVLIIALALRSLFANIFAPSHPGWLDAVSLVWLPIPALLSDVVQNYSAHQAYFLVSWSLCVGAIIGFVVGHQSRLRTPNRPTNRSGQRLTGE